MMYSVRNVAEYMAMLIEAFAKRFNLTLQEAQNYLSKYKALELVQKHYDIMHTQIFGDMVEDLVVYCQRKGGMLA